jgi:aryl-alcohol dehydrogenase-like predicted oxidoreductase
MQFGWLLSDVESMEVLDAYADAGGNFLETADMYGANQNLQSFKKGKAHVGVTEDIIGRWMTSRNKREATVIATKVRARMWEGPDGEGLARAHIVRAVDDCLRRLRTDHLDLIQAHWPDEEAPLDETIAVFDELVTDGKAIAWGTSNFSAFGVLEPLLKASDARHSMGPSCEQPRFSLVNQGEYGPELRSTILQRGMGMICFSPLAGGFLTGKYRRDSAIPESVRSSFVGQYLNEQGWALIDVLDEIANAHGSTIAAVSLAWILQQPGVTAPIVGANSVGQLEGWMGAGTLDLSQAELDRLTTSGWESSAPEFIAW